MGKAPLLIFLLISALLAQGFPVEGGEDGIGRRSVKMISSTPLSIDCGHACGIRCAESSRRRYCERACGTCCDRCNCVPPGTYGNKEVCPCYANMKTHGGKPKCP